MAGSNTAGPSGRFSPALGCQGGDHCTRPVRTAYTGGVGLCLHHAHERGEDGLIHPRPLPPMPSEPATIPACETERCLVQGCREPHDRRGCCAIHLLVLRNGPSPASHDVLRHPQTRQRLRPFWPALIDAQLRTSQTRRYTTCLWPGCGETFKARRLPFCNRHRPRLSAARIRRDNDRPLTTCEPPRPCPRG